MMLCVKINKKMLITKKIQSNFLVIQTLLFHSCAFINAFFPTRLQRTINYNFKHKNLSGGLKACDLIKTFT